MIEGIAAERGGARDVRVLVWLALHATGLCGATLKHDEE